MSPLYSNEHGSALLPVLIVSVLAGIALSSTLSLASTHTLTVKQQKDRSIEYFEAEAGIHRALNWLRTNSREFVSFLKMENIYTQFDLTNPIVGSNDIDFAPVNSGVKLNASPNTAILTTATELASASFPNGTTKDLVHDFSTFDFGPVKNRVTLVNVIPDESSKDYGDTDLGNPVPETHFYPVLRIDSKDERNAGTHLHAYVVGSIVQNKGVGFYGEEFVEMNQGCDSYDSSQGAYGGTNVKANCGVGSDGAIQLQQTEKVYGTLSTSDTIDENSPWGGEVCADFSVGCPNKGDACEGAACELPSLPSYDTWTTYCPTDQGDVVISSNIGLALASGSASDTCWNEIDVRPNKTLTLTSTDHPYFIKTFDIANNSTVDFQPSTPGGTINLYVEKFVGDKFNGNQIFNMNNTPGQLKIHYLGTDTLVMNGTAAVGAFIVAPYAYVDINGDFDYFGGIMAKALTFTGSGNVHYDETGQKSKLINVKFKMGNLVQQYKLH